MLLLHPTIHNIPCYVLHSAVPNLLMLTRFNGVSSLLAGMTTRCFYTTPRSAWFHADVALAHSGSYLLKITFLDHLLVQGRPLFESSSIFDLVPCLQSVGISSCLPVCCPSISFWVCLCSFSQKPLVAAILHRCGCVLASSSGQTTLVFCFPGKFQKVLHAS